MSKIQNSYQNFLKVQGVWEKELHQYSDKQLEKRETPESWTLGQVYVHLINSTLYFHLKQVNTCLTSSENQNGKKNFKGFLAYQVLKGFPPIKIKVPPSDFYTPKIPASKQEILDGFEKVKTEVKNILSKFENDQHGKTAHPGFSYLNASEWYRIIEMHWRHHLKQKNAIDKS
jgi:DinB superfamily